MAWLSCKATVPARYKIARLKPRLSAAGNTTNYTVGDSLHLSSLTRRIDFRLIFVGSMLADIIDKPLGIWLLRDTLSNGRVFSHTFRFTLVLVVLGIYLYLSKGGLGLLYLSFGCLTHLIFDEMWLAPRTTLLWPLYAWSFLKTDVGHWPKRVLASLLTEPSVYIPEIIGALLLGAFFF